MPHLREATYSINQGGTMQCPEVCHWGLLKIQQCYINERDPKMGHT